MLNKSFARFIYRIGKETKELVFEPTSGIKNEDLEIKAEKSTVINSGRLIITLIPKVSITIIKFEIEFIHTYDKTSKIYCNGYQSWTDSREFRIWEMMQNTAHFLHDLTSRSGDYSFYPYSERKGDLHSHTYTYIRTKEDVLYFFGSLNERCGYTIIQHKTAENKFIIIKDIAGVVYSSPSLLLDLFAATDTEFRVFEHYWRSHGLEKPKVQTVTGWTSWYYHYTKITPEVIQSNLDNFVNNQIPIDVFQIDDGYQMSTGDWINTNSKFPEGMKPIAKAIQEKGFKAGLWLAPLICEQNSFIFKEHPNWIVSPDGEHLQKAGYNPLWSGWYYALDIYNQEVRDYLKKVFDTIFIDWGFDMVKLDFLFAPALIPQRNKSRGQIMCEAMDLLRELCGDKIILGCGVPLGPAFGKVDYCRIGNDIGLNWETKWMKKLHIRERVSTLSSLNNTIGRQQISGDMFVNDPDVFILRKEKNQLSENQRQTLFILNHIFGGLVFTSDDISKYDNKTLDLYRKAFPHRNKESITVINEFPVYSFKFNTNYRSYLGFSNFSKKSVRVNLPDGDYYESTRNFIKGETQVELKAYETVILLKTENREGVLIGSNLHLFPGCETENWESTSGIVNFKLHKNAKSKGTILIDGGKAENLVVNGKKHEVYEVGNRRIVSVVV